MPSKLSEADKFELQQYITRCYKSLPRPSQKAEDCDQTSDPPTDGFAVTNILTTNNSTLANAIDLFLRHPLKLSVIGALLGSLLIS